MIVGDGILFPPTLDIHVIIRIQGPLELVVSSYRKPGMIELPNVPNFNAATSTLDHRLLFKEVVLNACDQERRQCARGQETGNAPH